MCLFPYGLSFIRVESLRYIPEPCCLLSSSKHPPQPPQEFPACLLALFVGLCLPLFRAVFSCNRQGPTSSQGNILPKKVGWKGLGLTWSPPPPLPDPPSLSRPPPRSLRSAQVLLPPNFKAVVARSLYSDPAHPGCSFVDLVEFRGSEHVF